MSRSRKLPYSYLPSPVVVPAFVSAVPEAESAWLLVEPGTTVLPVPPAVLLFRAAPLGAFARGDCASPVFKPEAALLSAVPGEAVSDRLLPRLPLGFAALSHWPRAIPSSSPPGRSRGWPWPRSRRPRATARPPVERYVQPPNDFATPPALGERPLVRSRPGLVDPRSFYRPWLRCGFVWLRYTRSASGGDTGAQSEVVRAPWEDDHDALVGDDIFADVFAMVASTLLDHDHHLP